MSNNGISKGTLLLLGGAAALLLSPSTRRRVIDVAGEALDGAHTLLEETIVPTAYDVAARAGDLTEEARKRALMAQDDLHDYLAEAQKEVERRRRELIHDTEDTRRDLSKKAHKAQVQAERRFMGFRHDAEEFAEDARKQAGRKLKVAQKEARKGLLDFSDIFGERIDDGRKMVAKRAAQAGKTAHKLDKHARKEIQGYQKEIARLEHQLERQAASIKLGDVKLGNLKHSRRSSGSLLPLLLLAGAGAVVVVPSLRKPVADALEGVSPEAAEYLRKAGEVAGKFWVEDMPPATPSAAPKPAQANASAAAASSAPDSPAAIKPAVTDTKTTDAKTDTKAADSKVDASKPEDKKEADKK